MTQNCQDCGSRFHGERWQRLCWSCWRKQRDGQAQDDAYRRGLRDGLAAAGRRQAPALDEALCTALLKLVHPDHHPAERYELANATTAALLELRGRLAA